MVQLVDTLQTVGTRGRAGAQHQPPEASQSPTQDRYHTLPPRTVGPKFIDSDTDNEGARPVILKMQTIVLNVVLW